MVEHMQYPLAYSSFHQTFSHYQIVVLVFDQEWTGQELVSDLLGFVMTGKGCIPGICWQDSEKYRLSIVDLVRQRKE